jgi:DNA-binding NtrC family response regulator
MGRSDSVLCPAERKYQVRPMGLPPKGKIIVLDHDLANRGFLRECLEGEGHEVVILNDVFQMRPHLSGGFLNVFILNVDTPGVREKDLLLEIRKIPQTRVLLVVSERGDAFLKEAMDLGVYGFIHKPFNLREVCTLVNHLLR